MLNLNKVNIVYLACGSTGLRKSIDGLVMLVETELKLNQFEKALFVFCNRQMNRIKILHFDEGFWLYYYRLENNRLKWPMTKDEAIKVNKEELGWLLKGYEGVLFKSMASNELIAHVVTMKYQHTMPLYRLKSYFKMLQANLSRQTLSNWIMGIVDIVTPLYEFMKTELLKTNYVQTDETTLQVIENNGK